MENLVLYLNQKSIPATSSEILKRHFTNSKLLACSVVVANLYECRDHYELNIMATGFQARHFEIQLNGITLNIKAEKSLARHEFIHLFCGKFNLNAFERSFQLPDQVDRSAIESNYSDGMLMIKLPKINR